MDRGYMDLKRMYMIQKANAFFVTRVRQNLKCIHIYSRKVDKSTGLVCDQTVRFKNFYSSKDYPEYIRRIKVYDKEEKITLILLTNNFEAKASDIAFLYKNRWKIELFFKWIKQHLKIKVFWGESENAVKTQIWIAVCNYILVAIIKEMYKIPQTMNEILQIISISIFDQTPLNQLFSKDTLQLNDNNNSNQLTIF